MYICLFTHADRAWLAYSSSNMDTERFLDSFSAPFSEVRSGKTWSVMYNKSCINEVSNTNY